MTSVFFVPVYNQREHLPILLEELRAIELPCDTILLVNDGSTDGSERMVRESGYPYIDTHENVGLGHATRLAVEWALERDYEIFGTLASNGKMLPSEMHRIVDPLREGKFDYVTGSRFLPGGDSPNLPRFREASIPLVNRFVRAMTGAKLTDATCGYRAYRLDIIRRMRFDWRAPWLNTYGFEYYLYAKVLLDGQIPWIEVPITMRYPEKGREYSKIRPVTGWYELLKPWVVARFDGKRLDPPARGRGRQTA
jgi:dolichol-phosphate mannosyltransferase